MLKKIYRKIKRILYILYKGIRLAWREYHFLIPPIMWKKYFLKAIEKLKERNNQFLNPFYKEEYNIWLKQNKHNVIYERQQYEPLISVIIPTYNTPAKYLSECINSVLKQSYQNFEICIADDCSSNLETIECLKSFAKTDDRIKIIYRKENGHISEATNTALEIAKGEYVALLDHDDLIARNALYEVVQVLNKDKSIDMIYSDEDKIDKNGNFLDPHFKPDWSPDTLLSMNYICHFSILRKKIVDDIGKFRKGYEGAQDYDLFLRFTEKTDNIYHLSKILYHWRICDGSTALSKETKGYAYENGKKALEDAINRRNISANVLESRSGSFYVLEYDTSSNPLISIIIPTRDYADTLNVCLKSIYEKTTYHNFEIIIANNNSIEEKTLKLFNLYKEEYKNFRVIDINTEFNYSNINNTAIEHANGEYVMLLNNDTEVISPNWLTVMLGYAMQSHIGAVGPKLYYPDGKIQHAGVILGLGGVASHAYIGFSKNDNGAYGRLEVPYNYSAVTAACLLISKKKFLEVGGLNEELKVAYNDVDLNIKLLDKGYYNLFVPQVELFHYESKSRGLDTTSEKYKRFLSEQEYMYNKWNAKIKNDKFYNNNFSLKGSFLLDVRTEGK